MSERPYYAYRRGAVAQPLAFDDLKRVVGRACAELDDAGWFQHGLGKDCTDASIDIGAAVLERLGWDAWPLAGAIADSDEDTLFTILEFLYDNVAKPLDVYPHAWNDCGIHVTRSDVDQGRAEYRQRINALLERYESPHLLREDGEIWAAAPSGLAELEPVPTGDPAIESRVNSAQSGFRRHGATEDDKRHAIHDLADILELLRDTVGTGLPGKDEARLFEIANQFAIRHHNPAQRTEYDSGLWLDWIYYAFLNSIAVATRLIAREQDGSSAAAPV